MLKFHKILDNILLTLCFVFLGLTLYLAITDAEYLGNIPKAIYSVIEYFGSK